MLRIAALLSIALLAGCGSLPLGQSATATPTPPPLLVATDVLAAFRSHGLEVDPNPRQLQGMATTSPLPTQTSTVLTGSPYIGLYVFKNDQEARDFVPTKNISTRRIAHRNVALEWTTNGESAAQPYVTVLLSLR